MSDLYYTDAANVQIIIALLKAHGIKRIIVNPGTANIPFVGSIQDDPFFELYSGIDERHSAYLACGLSAESGEPVVLSCTGATASRNYIPALTEAYYRKLPILAITSEARFDKIGNLGPQMVDRTIVGKDVVKYSIRCPHIHDGDRSAWRQCELNVNNAILELTRHGGGPVHIDLENNYYGTYKTKTLPAVRKISRYYSHSPDMPTLRADIKIAIWIGAHKKFSDEEIQFISNFVNSRNAVVLCDNTSSYNGPKAIHSALVAAQGIVFNPMYRQLEPELVIHIGEVSGDYASTGYLQGRAPVWRVSEDGELRDTFDRLECVFEMPEYMFWRHYTLESIANDEYFQAWLAADNELLASVPDLPFSNHWIAQRSAELVPNGCVLHLGIVNTLRNWDYFFRNPNVDTMSNVGGFGIDGGLSSLIGASLVDRSRLYFGVFGDLSFFYDMNALGSKHIGDNVRILLINNGCGGEFNLYINGGSKFGARVNDYIAAGHHFGDKSRVVVKNYVESLGFKYLVAEDKASFDDRAKEFFSAKMDKALVFECFTDAHLESEALEKINTMMPYKTLRESVSSLLPQGVKKTIGTILGK